jgi:hypothetical protein
MSRTYVPTIGRDPFALLQAPQMPLNTWEYIAVCDCRMIFWPVTDGEPFFISPDLCPKCGERTTYSCEVVKARKGSERVGWFGHRDYLEVLDDDGESILSLDEWWTKHQQSEVEK